MLVIRPPLQFLWTICELLTGVLSIYWRNIRILYSGTLYGAKDVSELQGQWTFYQTIIFGICPIFSILSFLNYRSKYQLYIGQKVNPDDYDSLEMPIEEEYFMTVIDRIFRFIEILESWLSFQQVWFHPNAPRFCKNMLLNYNYEVAYFFMNRTTINTYFNGKIHKDQVSVKECFNNLVCNSIESIFSSFGFIPKFDNTESMIYNYCNLFLPIGCRI